MKGSLLQLLPPFLMLLEEAKGKAGSYGANVDQLFQNIVEDISLMKAIFYRLEAWESIIHEKFGDIAKDLDRIYDGNNTEADFQNLEKVSVQISGLKKSVTSPLHLPNLPLKSHGSWNPDVTDKEIEDADVPADITDISDMPALFSKWEDVPNMFLLTLCNLPEQAAIKKSLLIQWWIGHKQWSDAAKSKEEAESFYEDLIRLGVVIPIRRDHSSVTHSCILHPLAREKLNALGFSFSEKLCRREHFNLNKMESFSRQRLHGSHPTEFKSYRCEFTHTHWLHKQSEESTQYRACQPAEVKACINLDQRYLNFKSIDSSFMTKSVILHFGRLQGYNKNHHVEAVNTEFLDWLHLSVDLRFLSLQGVSGITQLPPFIERLTNLVILDLQACHNLGELPTVITKLNSLIYLDVSECYMLKNMPKGMGSLSKLQVLKGFVIGSSGEQASSCKLQELSRLEELTKLSIHIKHDILESEKDLDELKLLSKLHNLTITWGGRGKAEPQTPEVHSTTTMSARSINKVSLPENLVKLDLRCFPRSTPAEWLSPNELKKLKKLYIRGGPLSTLSCDSFGIKWKVEVLRLRFLHEFVVPESVLKTQFPGSYIEIHECPSIPIQELGDA